MGFWEKVGFELALGVIRAIEIWLKLRSERMREGTVEDRDLIDHIRDVLERVPPAKPPGQ